MQLPDAPWIREAELWGMPDNEDAWERNDPDWETVCELIEVWKPEDIPGYVRDFLDGDGDLMTELLESGALKDYANPAVPLKDPDIVWNEADRIFSEEWENDTFMRTVWDYLDGKRKEALVKSLMADADRNGIRDLYDERWQT